MKQNRIKKQSSKDNKILNIIQMKQSEIKQLCKKDDKTKTIMTKSWFLVLSQGCIYVCTACQQT